MQYRHNFVKLQVKNIVDLFDMNDKSEIAIYAHDSSDVLFEGRVDYLQYNTDGEMSQLCSLEIQSLEVNGGKFIIYVEESFTEEK